MNASAIQKQIFHAYDIRGEIGREWCLDGDYNDAFLIGLAIGNQLMRRDSPGIVIARDGRLTSPEIAKAVTAGLVDAGCQVTDIGLTATPVLYFALTHLDIANGVMITGSHNPSSHNGIKIVYDQAPLSGIVIETLYYDIHIGELESRNSGQLNDYTNITKDYVQAIVDDISLQRHLKIGIDCGNGATATFTETLFRRLGCEVTLLNGELDGHFPGHAPDPTVPENLQALQQLVTDEQLDLGIAFDGDGDRMIAVDGNGEIIWPDRILTLMAGEVLKHHPACRIIYDVKCSHLLPSFVQSAGGQPAMCASGHSILKMHMRKLDAKLGGEFSGHIVMRDRWNDFDDGPYAATRLLEILSQTPKTPADVFASLPDSVATPEYKLTFASGEQASRLLESFIRHADFGGASLSLIDGIRVDYPYGWGLARASNTLPCLTFRFEADDNQKLEQIQSQFRAVFDKLQQEPESTSLFTGKLPF